MKKLLLIATFLFSMTGSYAQSFKHHISGTVGVLNPKIRLQYETPLNERVSTGGIMNYYLVNWKGPTIEPFIRLYGKRDGVDEGFYGQFKLIYGNLSILDDELASTGVKRWSTFGAGLGCGYKFSFNSGFTIEPYAGARFLSGPNYPLSDVVDPTVVDVVESVGWYVTTGFPLDFQLKFGYQF